MFQKLNKFADRTLFGRGFKSGVAESFGFHMEKTGSGATRGYLNKGFMGRAAKGGIKANFLGNALGLVTMGYSAYSGFREGGVIGAGKEVATQALTWGVVKGVWNMAAGMSTTLGVVGAGAALGYGGYRLGEAGQKYAKSLRRLEMGSDVGDPFGSIATTRQRSLAAIQNSHINGRMALGNEASMLHRTYVMR